jgi:hypothetical protein
MKIRTKSYIEKLLPEPQPNSEPMLMGIASAPILQNPMFKQHLRWAFLHLTPTYFSKLHFCCSSNINKNAKE